MAVKACMMILKIIPKLMCLSQFRHDYTIIMEEMPGMRRSIELD